MDEEKTNPPNGASHNSDAKIPDWAKRPGYEYDRLLARIRNDPEASVDTNSTAEELFAERLAQYQSALCSFDAFCKLDVKPRERLIGKWMLEGDTGFIFGQRGSGKTWLLDLIVSHLSSGNDINEDWDVPDKRHVVLVDGEMPLDDTCGRLKGLGADPEFLHILHHEVLFDRAGLKMNMADATVQQIIIKLCEDAQAKLLVLDTQSSLFRGMAEADADAWEKVLDWLLDLRRRRIATLIVLHAGWNSDHARGTSRREDDAFWVIKVKQNEDFEPNQRGCKFETTFTKHRNTDGGPIPHAWHVVTEADGTVSYSCSDLSFDDKVLDLIQSGEQNAGEIAKELGVVKRTVLRAISRLEQQNKVRRSGAGRKIVYQVTDDD